MFAIRMATPTEARDARPPIPSISARALQIGETDPSKAWQMVSAAQKNHFEQLPTEHFTADMLPDFEPASNVVRFVVISDTHSTEKRPDEAIDVPPGDVPQFWH